MDPTRRELPRFLVKTYGQAVDNAGRVRFPLLSSKRKESGIRIASASCAWATS
jgi:hypothetical protein